METSTDANLYPPFEDCRLTTMTLVFILEGSVELEPAFSLLPITRIDFAPPKRQKKKFELPHCSIPGAILSIRYSGETRGIVRSTNGGYFKNSITIDLSTTTKNVSTKLSQTKIQMCGASSEEQGQEGAQYLINHLLVLQEEIDYIKANPDKARETLNWLVEKTKGRQVSRPVYQTITKTVTNEKGEEVYVDEKVFVRNERDFRIMVPTDLTEAPNERIANFLIRQHTDFDYHSFLSAEMEWILGLKKIISQPLKIKKVIKAMVNYNYNLGFTVDRYTLYVQMLDRNGFISSYDNCIEHCVTIKLPYQPDPDEDMVRRKKVPCHCFLVYKSGVVTQTGPGGEKMKEAYNLFWKSILEIKDRIAIEIYPLRQPAKRKVVIKRITKPNAD